MLKIDEENSVPVKTKLQTNHGTPYVYLTKKVTDLGVNLVKGQEITMYVDRKAKIVYFRYGGEE